MNESSHNDEPRSDECNCPVCSFLRALGGAKEKHAAFHAHMYNARIEMLQAFRSLIDQRITILEKRKSSTEGKKATKIEVE